MEHPLIFHRHPGNQSPDSLSYLRTGLTAASCTDSLTVKDVQIDVLLTQAGDYTHNQKPLSSAGTFRMM